MFFTCLKKKKKKIQVLCGFLLIATSTKSEQCDLIKSFYIHFIKHKNANLFFLFELGLPISSDKKKKKIFNIYRICDIWEGVGSLGDQDNSHGIWPNKVYFSA